MDTRARRGAANPLAESRHSQPAAALPHGPQTAGLVRKANDRSTPSRCRQWGDLSYFSRAGSPVETSALCTAMQTRGRAAVAAVPANAIAPGKLRNEQSVFRPLNRFEQILSR